MEILVTDVQKPTNSRNFSLGTFMALPAFDNLDDRNRLPDKATSEINFFAKRILDFLKTKNLTQRKTDMYYRALVKYFASKSEKAQNTKESRIYGALSSRFSTLYSIWRNR